jgi:hypothetical protein
MTTQPDELALRYRAGYKLFGAGLTVYALVLLDQVPL